MAELIDIVQERYGWSDEYVLSIPYARFKQIVSETIKGISKREKAKWRELSFIGWQLVSAMSEQSPTFQEYYEKMFSVKINEDGEEEVIEQVPVDVEQAVGRANQILDMFT